MSEELKEEGTLVESTFWDDINWDSIKFNKIDKITLDRLKLRHEKLYATFLGLEDAYSFFLFKPIKWLEFKDIRAKKLDKDNTHDYILNTCVVYPKIDAIALNELDAGMALSLVYQILTMSNFFKDPSKCLELILEVK